MPWTQLFLTGLSKSTDPSDEEIETLLIDTYKISDAELLWAGLGSTEVKRDGKGCCRGHAFLSFHSTEGAMAVIDRINSGLTCNTNSNGTTDDETPNQELLLPPLHAELKKTKPKKDKGNKNNQKQDLPDLRIRRMRKAPVRKHPVITSSDGKRTNLGSKTK